MLFQRSGESSKFPSHSALMDSCDHGKTATDRNAEAARGLNYLVKGNIDIL